MKKMVFVWALCAPWWGWGQMVDGVNIGEKKDLEFIQIVGVDNGIFKKKLTVIIDYGQKIKAWDMDSRMAAENGEPVVFNSMVDALNYFNRYGWDFVTAYAIKNDGSSGSTYHYLLRRKKE